MVAPFSVDTSSKGTAKVAMAIAQRSMPPFRSADRVKLDGIEPGATNDQTGAELVASIDAQLGGTAWRAGGAGASWTEAEIDFGSAPVYSASFTITDAAITSSAVKLQVLPCAKAATGRTADDWEWDGATFAANPGTGSATCYALFTPGPIVGRRRIQYSIGA